MNYYKRHLGDYAAATGHLSLLEHGVYNKMLDRYYLSEQPLPAVGVDLYRILGARSTQEKQAVATVAQEFFKEIDGRLHQKRADEELEVYKTKADKNRAHGSLGGRPSKTQMVSETEPKQNPDGCKKETQMVSEKNPFPIANSHKPIAISQKINTQEPAASPPRRPRKPVEIPLPADFCISDRVRKWAKDKGFGDLEARFEHFIGKAKAKGYTYADWDEGFMGAIRDGWARPTGPSTAKTQGFEGADYYAGVTADGRF